MTKECDHVFAIGKHQSLTVKYRLSQLDLIRENIESGYRQEIAACWGTGLIQRRIELEKMSEEDLFRHEMHCLDHCCDCGAKNTVFPLIPKDVFPSQIVVTANTPTCNGFAYSLKEVENLAQQINTRNERGFTVLGELGAPNPQDRSVSNIELMRVSHQVLNARVIEGGVLVTDVKVLDTPNGKILRQLLDTKHSLPIVFRIRAAGNQTTKDGISMMEDVQLITIDACSQ